ncbi:hypothetical protein BY458DRAFT_103264 [Sporodiniella umbellata]|nr:hypothetical protein BY458DRAFT_103264 [Sporodiniella umbellata]
MGMLKLVGMLILTFCLGYIAALFQLFDYILQKHVVYTFLSISTFYLVLFIPLEKIAEREAKNNPLHSVLQTSAREHLQRRGSF